MPKVRVMEVIEGSIRASSIATKAGCSMTGMCDY